MTGENRILYPIWIEVDQCSSFVPVFSAMIKSAQLRKRTELTITDVVFNNWLKNLMLQVELNLDESSGLFNHYFRRRASNAVRELIKTNTGAKRNWDKGIYRGSARVHKFGS